MRKGIKITLVISGVLVLGSVMYFVAKNKGWIKNK